MIWVWRCQANIVSSLQSRGRRSSFSAEHWRKGSRYNKRVGHTRQFPSIRPSAHEKDTVDRRHRSTFKVTKQGKNRADLLAATTQGAKKKINLFFAMNVSPTLRQAWLRELPEAAMCVQDIDVQCVLQFTLIHAAGCALHRHTSRVIHRLE